MKPLAPERAILLKAAEYIRERGHCKEQFSDSRGRVCLIGALLDMAAGKHIAVYRSALYLLEGYLSDKSGGLGVPCWNDAPERTKEEVVAALEMAALHEL